MDDTKEPESGSKKQNLKPIINYFETTVDLLRVTLWPLVVLIIFFHISGPLVTLLNGLPDVLSKTTKLTVAGVAIEIDHKLGEAASPELRSALKNISSAGLIKLVDTGSNTMLIDKGRSNYEEKIRVVRELQKLGLAELKDNEELGGVVRDHVYSLTPLGNRAYDLILKILVSQLVEKKIT